MPGYTKANFASQYRDFPCIPGTNKKLARYHEAALFGEGVYVTLQLGYHPLTVRPICEQRSARIIEECGLTSESSVAIVGGAYGWTGEAMMRQLPGLDAVSVDISSYIHATKNLSPDAELVECIRASGYDETAGIGLQLFEWFSDPEPLAKIPVLNERLDTVSSRKRVNAALSRPVTHVLTEDMWQLLTPEEQIEYEERLALLGDEVIHYFDGRLIRGEV